MTFSTKTSQCLRTFVRIFALALVSVSICTVVTTAKSRDKAQGQDLTQLQEDVGLPDGPVLDGLEFKEPDYPTTPGANTDTSSSGAKSGSQSSAPKSGTTAQTDAEPASVAPVIKSGAPGKLTGRVADAETIAFIGDVLVSIIGVDGTTKTDDEGIYTLENLQPGTYTVAFSKQGFVRVRVTEVEILPGATKKLDMTLQPDYGNVTELDAVTMTISSLDTSEVILLAERKEAYSFQDSIGSDDFARFGVDDAAGALGKVTGVSVQDGKYVVVRGLSDRYNNTMLNGVLVPTPDPDKKAVQLDLFPSKLLENIIVSKTFTPDQPGDFTGGSVNLITKTFPDAFTASASFSLGFNTNATFDDNFLTYDGGIWDMFGVDDGTRDIPGIAQDYELPGNGRRYDAGSPESQYVNEVTQAFNNTMVPKMQAPGPNISFSGSVADQGEIAGQTVGVVASVSYDYENSGYANGVNQRLDSSQGGGSSLDYTYNDNVGTTSVLMGGLLSVGWEIAPENSINFTTIYNRATDNEARVQYGTNSTNTAPGVVEVVRSLSFIQREIYTFNLAGSHKLSELNDVQIDWVASKAHTSQVEPDTRFFNNFVYPNGDEVIAGTGTDPRRLWRDLQEERPSGKLDVTVPLNDYIDFPGDSMFKTGGSYLQSSRTFTQTEYQYKQASHSGNYDYIENNPPLLEDGADDFPNPDNAGFPTTDYSPRADSPNYVIAPWPGQAYDGYERIRAGYLMADLAVLEDLQLIGGVRFEQTLMSTEATVASNPYGDVSNGYIKQTDALPSVALTYAVADDINIRLAFSQTIARPTMRELAPYNSVDYLGGNVFVGNPILQLSNIDNFDFRVEWFPDAGEVIAFSLFAKQLDGPIERVLYTVTGAPNEILESPFNANTGTMYGAELEIRKSLAFMSEELENFSLNANLTLIDAMVNVGGFFKFSEQPGAIQVNVQDRDRQLQGQPKYIVNLGLNYDNIDWGTSVSLNLNKTSDILYAAAADTSQFPDVYETGVPSLDLIIRQAVAENWTISFKASNLVNPNFERYYSNGTLYSVSDGGRTFSIGASYSFE